MLDLDKEELYDGKSFDEYFNVHWSHCIDEVKKDKISNNRFFDLEDYLFSGFFGFVYKSCIVIIIMFVLFNFFEFLNYALQFIKLYHVIIFSFLYVLVRTLFGFIKFK